MFFLLIRFYSLILYFEIIDTFSKITFSYFFFKKKDFLDNALQIVNQTALPEKIRDKLLSKYNLTLSQSKILMEENGGVEYFENVALNRDPQVVISW